MASGLGKTLVAADIIHNTLIMKDTARILFLCDSRDIITQAHDVCQQSINDKSVTMSVFCSTDTNTHSSQVVFATFAGLRRHTHLYSNDTFDLIIVDEAHHACAPTYKKTITYFSPTQLLALTATPNRMDKQDIRDIFGEIVYTYTLAQALADQTWLADLSYFLLTDNFSEKKLAALQEMVCNGERVTQTMLDACFQQERLESVAKKLRTEHAGKKTIVFAQNISHAKQVEEVMPEARAYHSELSQKRQQDILTAFRNNTLSIIVTIDKFNEGVDIPDADVLVFLRSTASETVWLQQLGRGLRKTTDKTHVTILDYVGSYTRLKQVDALDRKVREAQEKNTPSSSTFTVPGLGLHFTKVLQDIVQILARIHKDFYPTIEEAMEAVQRLDPVPTLIREYHKTYTQDARLPSNPDQHYSKEVWDRIGGWKGFLGQPIPEEKYATTEEAMVAVQRLDPVPTIIKEYQKTYHQDARLPSNPDNYYGKEDWDRIGKWIGFLGTGKYPTIEEAMEAVQRLDPVPTSHKEYQKTYIQDARLPSSPNEYYRKEAWDRIGKFIGFLGTGKYPTIEEAMAAVQRLDPVPTLIREYHKTYTQDARLLSAPDKYYSKEVWGRIGKWKGFLGTGKYKTIEEAMAAVQRLDPVPKKQREYKKTYPQDARLPSNPNEYYRKEAWDRIGKFIGFLGKR